METTTMNYAHRILLLMLFVCSLCFAPFVVEAGTHVSGGDSSGGAPALNQGQPAKERDAPRTQGEKNLDLLNKISPKPGPSDSRPSICGEGGC
jgi:hypothetical protein